MGKSISRSFALSVTNRHRIQARIGNSQEKTSLHCLTSALQTLLSGRRQFLPLVCFSDLNQYGHCQGTTLSWYQICAVRNRPWSSWHSLPPPGLQMPRANGPGWQCLLSPSFGSVCWALHSLKKPLQQLLPGGWCSSCAAGASLGHRGSPSSATATGIKIRSPDQI